MNLRSKIKDDSEGMNKQDIEKYLELLNDKLRFRNKRGEITMVGGAVMCLCFESRESTMDIDAIFEPQYDIIHLCAKEIALEFNLPTNWLNDGVSVYLSKSGKYSPYKIMSNLKIYTATPEYMLAMKCISGRVNNQNEIGDIKFLLNYLQITSIDVVFDTIIKFYPIDSLKDRMKSVLQEIFKDE
jgi:hypothetical protein